MPNGLIPEKPGYHAVEQDRMLRDGKLNFYWIMVNNNLQAAANNTRELIPATATRTTLSSSLTPTRLSPRWRRI